MSVKPTYLLAELMREIDDTEFDFDRARLIHGADESAMSCPVNGGITKFPNDFRNVRIENAQLDSDGIWTFDAVRGNVRYEGVRTCKRVDMLHVLLKHLGVIEQKADQTLYARVGASSNVRIATSLSIYIGSTYSEGADMSNLIVTDLWFGLDRDDPIEKTIEHYKNRGIVFAPDVKIEITRDARTVLPEVKKFLDAFGLKMPSA